MPSVHRNFEHRGLLATIGTVVQGHRKRHPEHIKITNRMATTITPIAVAASSLWVVARKSVRQLGHVVAKISISLRQCGQMRFMPEAVHRNCEIDVSCQFC